MALENKARALGIEVYSFLNFYLKKKKSEREKVGQEERDLRSKMRSRDKTNTKIPQLRNGKCGFLFRFLLFGRKGEGFANTFK